MYRIQHGWLYFLHVMLLLCYLGGQRQLVNAATTADGRHCHSDRLPSTITTTTTAITWEEIRNNDERDEKLRTSIATDNKISIRRMSFWDAWKRRSTKETRNDHSKTDIPQHPLRTNLWELKMHWRTTTRHSPSSLCSQRNLVLELDNSGYARIRPSNSNDNNSQPKEENTWFPSIGTWHLDPGSLLVWYLPQSDNHTYEFRAYFHVNPFGKHPKMIRGTVVRHDLCKNVKLRTKWFPPVVASFTAVGCGHDTADFSYQKRKPPRQV